VKYSRSFPVGGLLLGKWPTTMPTQGGL